MRTSVVLPSYNGALDVADQLQALSRQNWGPEDELVFVNHGSTDQTRAIAEGYLDRIPNMRIVDVPQAEARKGGVTHAYDTGLRNARGSLLLICDHDDEVAENWLAEMTRALGESDIACCAIEQQKLNPPELVWGSGGPQSRDHGKLPDFVAPLYLPYGMGCSMGMTRAVYEATGGPANDVGGSWDTDLCWRAQLAGFKIAFVPETHVSYRVRQGADERYRQARRYGRDTSSLIIKHGRPKPIRFMAHIGWRLAKNSVSLAAGVLTRRRPYAYYVWDLGYVRGELDILPDMFRAVRAAAPRSASVRAAPWARSLASTGAAPAAPRKG
jgi:GT2 family glycosyltransferase